MRPGVARPRLALAAAMLGCVSTASGVIEPPPEPIRLGLYEWMGTAPIVVLGDVLVDDGKFVQASVAAAVKGGARPGTELLVDLRAANRDREDGVPALKLDKGNAYLFLLKPSSKRTKETLPVYDLVRGTRGARPVRAEGREALLDAAVRLGAVQDRKSDELLWQTLPSFLEDANPLLVDAALELYVKFQRESAGMAPVLEPLLESPRPSVREQAVVLVGRILGRAHAADVPERAVLIGELIGRARRDDVVAVRRAATRALAPLPDPGIEETLRTIAQDDADQDVRLDAEKSLYERALAAKAPARPD